MKNIEDKMYAVVIWTIIIGGVLGYTVLFASTMKDSMRHNCIMGALKAKGEVPSQSVIDWCNSNF